SALAYRLPRRCFSLLLVPKISVVIIYVLPPSNWLPCSSSDNQSRNQAAADRFAQRAPAVSLGNVVCRARLVRDNCQKGAGSTDLDGDSPMEFQNRPAQFCCCARE